MLNEDVDFLISFDPKSCTIPNSYCCTNCEECYYNPLEYLLDPYEIDNITFVITRQDIIDTLLDTINLLSKAYYITVKKDLT